MSVDEATPFYAHFECRTAEGFVFLTATRAEASQKAREFAVASGKSVSVKPLDKPVLVVSGWTPAEPVHQDEVATIINGWAGAPQSAPVPAPAPTGCEVPGCDSHKAPAVPHNNCMYGGRRMGHSPAHCTADACF